MVLRKEEEVFQCLRGGEERIPGTENYTSYYSFPKHKLLSSIHFKMLGYLLNMFLARGNADLQRTALIDWVSCSQQSGKVWHR